MSEWLESLKENLSFSDIIAFLSMIGAIMAAVFAWISKLKAKNRQNSIQKMQMKRTSLLKSIMSRRKNFSK